MHTTLSEEAIGGDSYLLQVTVPPHLRGLKRAMGKLQQALEEVDQALEEVESALVECEEALCAESSVPPNASTPGPKEAWSYFLFHRSARSLGWARVGSTKGLRVGRYPASGLATISKS